MHSITIAGWSYDRVRPIVNGQVRIEGCEATFIDLEPEEMFHRALHFEEFDVTELSLSNYLTLTARDSCPYTAIPVFPGRRFRHAGIYINTRSGIQKPEDLRGKRVNIGNPGSGQRQNAIDALQSAGIDFDKDVQAESVKAAEAPGLLQDDRIDAFFYTVGHPSGAIKEATAGRRKVHFVPIETAGSLMEKFPYYAPATIAKANYPMATNEGDVPTFGVKATFVTSTTVSDEVVYAVTKEVFGNLAAFKKLHPAYADLTAEGMLQGLSAPLHPGALRYYKEAGLK